MLGDLDRAKIVITNYHSFKLRERMETVQRRRSLLQGPWEQLNTLETEGQIAPESYAEADGYQEHSGDQ